MSTPAGANSIVETCRQKIVVALETDDVKVTGATFLIEIALLQVFLLSSFILIYCDNELWRYEFFCLNIAPPTHIKPMIYNNLNHFVDKNQGHTTILMGRIFL
jgi:hypothetical protein